MTRFKKIEFVLFIVSLIGLIILIPMLAGLHAEWDYLIEKGLSDSDEAKKLQMKIFILECGTAILGFYIFIYLVFMIFLNYQNIVDFNRKRNGEKPKKIDWLD